MDKSVDNHCFSSNIGNMATELAKLHILHGGEFIKQLKLITSFADFHMVETGIYAVGGKTSDDYDNQLNAARKATTFGYTVYILPNPKSTRSADFIFVRKGVYKLFDLKTISGKNSVGNRLQDSIGQTNRVLLNFTADYNLRHLAKEVKRYFEQSNVAQEVLIFSGGISFSATRNIVLSKGFLKMLLKSFR